MKKKSWIVLLILALMLAFTACGGNGAPADNGAPAPSGGGAAAPPDSGKPAEGQPTYKEIMVPFDQIVPSERIVILQNTVNFSREGFYTSETKPVAEDIDYKGETAAAYPMTYAIEFLTNGCNGTVAVTETDGSSTEIPAEDFSGMYAILTFDSEVPPVLYNPATKSEVSAFAYAITEGGEAVYSVVSGSTHNAAELIATAGWDPKGTFRYMATDQFHIPVPEAENSTGEVRGTLSGAVNGSFPDLNIASGKINDVIYIEKIEE